MSKISKRYLIEYLASMTTSERMRIMMAARHLRKVKKLSEKLKSKDELLDEAVKELEE